ncbi:hypothetical protein G7046_g8410 [Stylonectria norvegica]|nr:hypothetical protein G7046_g8410 [Stylonectria norvegica]
MLGAHGDSVAGRPYLVTDEGPPLRFQDLYTLLGTASATGFSVSYPSPLLLLLVAYGIEAWCLLLARFPLLQQWLAEPADPVNLLQPGTFGCSVSCIVDDSAARRAPGEGGFGYQGACTSVEGMCAQVVAWNDVRDGDEEGERVVCAMGLNIQRRNETASKGLTDVTHVDTSYHPPAEVSLQSAFTWVDEPREGSHAPDHA